MTPEEAQQAQTIVEGFNGWKFSAPWESLAENIKWAVDFLEDANALAQAKFFVYLIERCRHNESLVDYQAQKIAEQEKELKLLRYVLEAEKTARIYEDGTGAAGEALFHARKELEEWDAKTDSKEVAR